MFSTVALYEQWIAHCVLGIDMIEVTLHHARPVNTTK
jgi:hypothetical protein